MPDRIQKLLEKLPRKQREEIVRIVTCILMQNFTGLDVVKLVGKTNIYRVRKGAFRILFRLEKNEAHVLAIERRSENTYR